ncbi:winged helix-turn-helix transcriptional regulator [Pelagibius litoralis]|uniref:Winged helix-turn-helix transcriptional regulator n=1 Tax=Pelagibius litoralis TaxID=374515 RepID=A0A967KD77_9PROT|nr:MarR family winged helix-turn-helix transcriptional regulator [Pelagibius litoralis]NIA72102.1 winged helix-turn-helix transcriptional regulator [Pelagibius litoralis]
MDSRVIAELILHLGRIASGDGLVAGLTPGQWAILRYFTRANRFSRTPSAFAAFHGTTRGTASQAIKSLVAQGFLMQTQSETDGRSVRLDLTDKARAIIANDPIEALVRATDALPPGVRGAFSHTLQRVLGQVVLETGKPLFGTCENCAHFEDDGCCKDGLAAYGCGFLNEPLMDEELDQLCVNFASDRSGPPRTPGVGVT